MIELHLHLPESAVPGLAGAGQRGLSESVGVCCQALGHCVIGRRAIEYRPRHVQQSLGLLLIDILSRVRDGGEQQELFAFVAVECQFVEPQPSRMSNQRLEHADLASVMRDIEPDTRCGEGLRLRLVQQPVPQRAGQAQQVGLGRGIVRLTARGRDESIPTRRYLRRWRLWQIESEVFVVEERGPF